MKREPPEEQRYAIDMQVSVRVYATDADEAVELASASTANWDDWHVIEVAHPHARTEALLEAIWLEKDREGRE